MTQGILYVHSEDNPSPWQHNYHKKLQRMIADGTISAEEATSVHVYHDDWCGVFRGKRCNCDPNITVKEVPAVKES